MRILSEKWHCETICTGNGTFDQGNTCGAMLEVEIDDLFDNGEYSPFRARPAFKCPQCGCVTELSKEIVKKMPKEILKSVSCRTVADIDRKMRTEMNDNINNNL